jgi:hypothetical protein
LALETSRIGVFAPCLRASSPMTGPAGSARAGQVASRSSSGCGRYMNDGSIGRSSTESRVDQLRDGIICCSTSSPSHLAISTKDSAECVVPRSMPMENAIAHSSTSAAARMLTSRLLATLGRRTERRASRGAPARR